MDMNQWCRGAVARAAALVTAAVATVGGPLERPEPTPYRGAPDPAKDAEALEQARLRRLEKQRKRANKF